jgi:hypothetical protein
MAVEQWNRQLLQRDRSMTVERVVVEAGGIYSTAPTSYLSFAARIPGFVNDDLDRALYRDRSLVRLSALRGSGFLVPITMIDEVVAANDRRYLYEQWIEKLVGVKTRESWRVRILALLDGRVMPAREIRSELGVSAGDSEALRFLLSALSQNRQVAAASGTRGWRDNQHGYALWSQWFPDHPPIDVDPESARVKVANWYLKGHGPGSVDHFAWWSGMKKGNAAEVLSHFDEIGPGVFDLDDPPDRVEPSGLRLLPVWDTALVAPKGRRRMVRTAHQPFVYDASGNLTSTIVRDGGVIGVWSRGGDDTHFAVKAAPFESFTKVVRLEIEDEANLVGAAVGATQVSVEFVDEMPDLTTASRNRFLSPLKDS